MMNAMTESLTNRVARFNFDYSASLNRGRFGEWPNYFVEEACDYRVLSRENHDAGLPAPILGCYTHGMVKDRVAMLVKETLTYRKTYLRHYITNIKADLHPEGRIIASANLLVMQSSLEGESSMYMVAQYEDEFADIAGSLKLRKRWVIVDSFNIDNMLAIPL